MYKLILLAACLAVASCMPKPGLEYEHEDKPFGGLSFEDYQQNPFAQKLFSIKEYIPWLSVRTYGILDKDKKVSTFTRAGLDWAGINVFGDVSTSENDNKIIAGVGGGLGELVKLYFTEDTDTKDNSLLWEVGI